MNDRFKLRFWDKKEKEYFTCGDIDHKSGIFKTYPYRTYNWCFEHKNIIAEQCTGLNDKNGKLIYEGDICIPAKDMADKAGEVYRAESGAYLIKGRMKSGMEYDFGIYWHHYMYEVIGNIHENADLLNVGGK